MRDEQDHGDRPEQGGGGSGGPDTRFVQFEMSELVREAGHRAFEEAFHKTLTGFIQEELRSRYAEQFKELASLALEQCMGELRRNTTIQQLVKENKAHEEELRSRAAELVSQMADKSAPSK